MIDHIIGFSIKNKIVIGLMVLGLILCGAWSLSRIPIDAVPDITNNQVQVITQSPSLAAQEIERFITYPLELSFANIPGVVEIRSISRLGLSVITVVFDDDVDTYLARQLISEKIASASQQIPPGMGTPEMAPVTTGLGEIYQYVLYAKKGYEKEYDAMELRSIQDWIVKRRLAGIEGVVDISSFGGYQKQYEVSIAPEVLRSYNISILEIYTALVNNNENTGGSYIEKLNNAYFIRGEGLITSLEDIRKIVIRKNNRGFPVTIGDVAVVKYGHAVRYGALTMNGKGEAVGGIVLMLKGANSAAVIHNVKERIAEIKKTLPVGVQIEAYLDRTILIEKAIHTVTANLVEGGLIVIFVLVLLLGNLRAGLIVASVIPLSMLFAISLMNIFGVSANLMSLGAIDFGLIVDGAVIIVEAIILRISSIDHTQGKIDVDQEVLTASVKIRQSAAFGEIIILIVYLPILALVGIEGKMFKPMAQTVGFAIIGALILSLTYVPMMSSLFLGKAKHGAGFSERLINRLYKYYEPIIRFALKWPRAIMVSVTIVFFFSLYVLVNLGGEFLPSLDEGDFAVETRLASGSSLSQTIETSTRAEKILLGFPEVKEVVSKIGTAEIPTDPMPIEANDLMVILKDKKEWTTASSKEALADTMKKALETLPGVQFEFQQPIQMRFNELMTGVKSDIAIKIYGEDLNLLNRKAKESAQLIKGIEGVADLRIEQTIGLPQIQVKYDRDKIAEYGLNIKQVNSILRASFAGEKTGEVMEGEKRFDLVVRLNQEYRGNIDNIKGLYVDLPNGTKIPIEEVATIEFNEGPMQISRDDTKRRITIGINVRNRDVQSVVEDIQSALETGIHLPSGYFFTYGGQFENLEKAKGRLKVAVPVALFLIFVLLYFTFNSFKESLMVFTAIPLSAIGGIFFLWLRDMPFSISAAVGFIALFGVSVLNGIVMISYFNQLKAEGIKSEIDRVLIGTKVRFRPIFITAAVASLGFLPMAMSNSAGAEVQKPLATVVVGGLITATLLTLVILPILYTIYNTDEENVQA
ncbi:MAG: efflux RND transporter permease subunit [Cytophagaceae bacterium]